MNIRTSSTNAAQIEYWNSDAAANWVRHADGLDFMLREVGDRLLARAELRHGDRVVDVGCGSGAITLAAQDRVGDAGRAIGLDISRALILEARRRAADVGSQATFIETDAATWRDETQADAVISRLGVMFFDNPIAAFANMLHSARPGGRLDFVCWCSPKESDMGSGLMKAVSALFEKPNTPADPTAPGPYAFADQDRVRVILTDAGWQDVNVDLWEGFLPLPGHDVSECAAFAANIGAIARLMREQNVALERVVDALVPFLERRMHNGRIALRGLAWFVSAHKSRRAT